MSFVLFHEFFPEVAKKETRSIAVPPGGLQGVPEGSYGFLEMFCDESGCDCRRVMFSVVSLERQALEAVIAWGWEDRAFYARWFGMNAPEMVNELKGPILNLGSPQTKDAGALLRMTEDLLLTDPAYVERVQRHYALFREQIDQKEGTGGRAIAGSEKAHGVSKKSKERRKRRRRPGLGGGN